MGEGANDCQLIISRPDQLPKISSLKVNYKFNECASNKVKLIWHFASSTPSLLLFQKRSESELCVLPVETPHPLNIQGDELFCYSLRSSLIRLSKCSRLNGIKIEIQTLFPDELYSDLFYLLDYSPSNIPFLHQLRLSLNGQLRNTEEIFSVDSLIKFNGSPDFLLSNDPQTKRLFIVPRKLNLNSIVEWICPFDLLYRHDYI
uniref:FBD domain-containing protein n=1 Tax=Meloidogyne hapla TaxID=6305 RepID=A0A1I8BNA1_MELHA